MDIEINTLLRTKNLSELIILCNRHDIPVSSVTIDGKTDILLETIVQNNFILCSEILDMGFDLNKGEFNYLLSALRTKNDKLINLLVEKTSIDKINQLDDYTNNNALHLAINEGLSSDFIMRLSKRGVSWNTKNYKGHTPLHLLLRSHTISKEIVDEIIEKADFTIEDNTNISPLDVVKSSGLSKKWQELEATQYLIKKLEDSYESK